MANFCLTWSHWVWRNDQYRFNNLDFLDLEGRHDTQHNDSQHTVIQHKDTQHTAIHNKDTLHNDSKHRHSV
jgi:hypothetical protein